MDEDAASALRAWAASGAMALTGEPHGPPCPEPAFIAPALDGLARELAAWTRRWGTEVTVDGPALLGERAAFTNMTRNGSVSVGGVAHFIGASDGWVVLNLPRPDDVASLPALVGEVVSPDDWPTVLERLSVMSAAQIQDRAVLLGLAAAVAGNPEPAAEPVALLAEGAQREVVARPLVVDLTSLWAGPLAGSLLAQAGARVIKVESTTRPDGARRGPAPFFDLLNHDKECLSLDLDDRGDVGLLHRLLERADLVLEGSRPRVMDRLGVDPVALAARGVSWVSVTGHGRIGGAGDRIGFGDDAAVAGGLWIAPGGSGSSRRDRPCFVADAVADPIAGLAAAATGAALLAGPRALVMEAPLVRAASWAAGPPIPATVEERAGRWQVRIGDDRADVAAPFHRRPAGRSRRCGADDGAVRAELAGPAG